ncbi:MAG: hypothetical protein PHW60_13350 [Kiritimatiellae bacterium]|nr:hypothetical protein [Kiritimatiellia bacterium]
MPQGQVKIGWGSRDVTPDRAVNLNGLFHVRVSQKVNDPVTVTAMAVEAPHSRERMVIVSCDCVGVPGIITRRVSRKLRAILPELDPRQVVFCSTHTHSAPALADAWYPRLGPEVMTPAAYGDFFCGRAAEAVAEAWRSRRLAGVGWGLGRAVVGHNRRIAYLDGTSLMYGKVNRPDFAGAEGGEDSAVDLLFTWDKRRTLTGVVVNLACPSQVCETAYYVSADFWHDARAEIRKRLGKHIFILPLCGAAGDQSPAPLLHQRAERLMRKRREPAVVPDFRQDRRSQIGKQLGQAVEAAFADVLKDIRTDVPFRHVRATLRLPRNVITRAEYQSAVRAHRKLLADHSLDGRPTTDKQASTRFSYIQYQKSVIDRYHDKRKYGLVEVHAGRIGDMAFATNPFELFLDYGLRIKERSPATQTMVIQLATPYGPDKADECVFADRYLDGYLPTERSIAGGGYGASALDCSVGPQGGQMLVEKTLRLIKRLW